MEFGPRLWGAARSWVMRVHRPCNPSSTSGETRNLPAFAPSILRETSPIGFELDQDSPYICWWPGVAKPHRKTPPTGPELFGIDKLKVPRSDIAGGDSRGLLRPHTEPCIGRQIRDFYELLSCFKQRTGCPVIVNTSFNVRGEPIVCTPEDAFRCFMGTAIGGVSSGELSAAEAGPGSESRADQRDRFRTGLS